MKERVSKRILGFVAAVTGLTLTTLDGFEWFNANEIILIGVYSFSAALLGIDTYKQLNSN